MHTYFLLKSISGDIQENLCASASRPSTTVAGMSNRSVLLRPTRTNIWLLLAVVLLAACSGAACRGNSVSVATVQSENDAIEILDLLRENNIVADKVPAGEEGIKGWSIIVHNSSLNNDSTSRAIRVMQDNGLPRPTDKGLEDAGKDNSIVKSESAQKAQRMKEQKTEIERQLRALPGVTRANVNIAIAKDIDLSINPSPPSASVLLVMKQQIPELTEAKVQRMVANSVLGLTPEHVSVTMVVQPPRPFSTPQSDGSFGQHATLLIALMGGGLTVMATLVVVMLMQNRATKKGAEDGHAEADIVAGSPSNFAQSWMDEGHESTPKQ
ncbi:MAG: hypothetical protein H0W76_00585 [Pyrinomonadaceae bacterium]|nr:hypothetical protein [Pyrinomonadaceae bacterium]